MGCVEVESGDMPGSVYAADGRTIPEFPQIRPAEQ